MIVQVGKFRPSELAGNALLLVPLWHILTSSSNTPFKMQEFRDFTHCSANPVWWGITDLRLQEVIDSLKTSQHDKDLYDGFHKT